MKIIQSTDDTQRETAHEVMCNVSSLKLQLSGGYRSYMDDGVEDITLWA